MKNAITCNRVPLKHLNTIFTYVPIKKLRGRCVIPEIENKFKKRLYKSIKERGILDPLLVWFVTGVSVGPKSGFLVRVGSSRLQICMENSDLGIKELPCFILNFKGTYKSTKRNKGFFGALIEGELMNSREKVLTYCHNKDIQLRFSEQGWLTYAVSGKFLKQYSKYE